MERVVPWGALVELLVPYAPEGKKGRPPFAVEVMLRPPTFAHQFRTAAPSLEQPSRPMT